MLRFETPTQIVNKANSDNNTRGRFFEISIEKKQLNAAIYSPFPSGSNYLSVVLCLIIEM